MTRNVRASKINKKAWPPPKLSNSETIVIEITRVWLGFHSDEDIRKYFKQVCRCLSGNGIVLIAKPITTET